MTTFRKRGLTQGTQWNKHGDHPHVNVLPPGVASFNMPEGVAVEDLGYIQTKEGGLVVAPGNWIMGPGPDGEYWLVSDNYMKANYEEVQEEKPEEKPEEKKTTPPHKAKK